jgi:hypothetical protein
MRTLNYLETVVCGTRSHLRIAEIGWVMDRTRRRPRPCTSACSILDFRSTLRRLYLRQLAGAGVGPFRVVSLSEIPHPRKQFPRSRGIISFPRHHGALNQATFSGRNVVDRDGEEQDSPENVGTGHER